jgi:hypothetical protein
MDPERIDITSNTPPDELLRLWEAPRPPITAETQLEDAVAYFEYRNELLKEMKRRGLFPSEKDDTTGRTTGAYPDAGFGLDTRGQFVARDPLFLTKLMARQEFADSRQTTWEPPTDPCEDEFEVTPVQRFAANFLSPKSPYMSALLFHGVGVGKTCAAVQVAENWLNMYPSASRDSRRQVIIVAPRAIRDGFKSTIFNIGKVRIGVDEKTPNFGAQCTGSTYMELTDTLYERDANKIKLAAQRAVGRRYEFYGYQEFKNTIKRIMGTNKALQVKNIQAYFNNRLLIIDEAHNLRELPGVDISQIPDEEADMPGGETELEDTAAGRQLTPYLEFILKYTTGMKLLLLTATPMYNSYREIIYLLNLLLKNDKKIYIRESDIFADMNGTFTTHGRENIGLIASRYVSFMRGENPASFPLRLKPYELYERITDVTNPGEHEPTFEYPLYDPRGEDYEIPEEEKEYVRHLPIVGTEISPEVEEAVVTFSSMIRAGEAGISSFELQRVTQAANLLVPPPIDESDEIPNTMEGFVRKYQPRIDANALELHFTKTVVARSPIQYKAIHEGGARWLGQDQFATWSPKYAKCLSYIQGAEGVVFCYTRYVQNGAVPFALMLEANGYKPYGRDTPLLADGVQTPGGGQCALCSRRQRNHGPEAGHEFAQAYYALLTGRVEFSPNNIEAIRAEQAVENKEGRIIKVVIGSEVAAEGIDLRYIREVHIMDAWFHLNKIEQIIGRGIRYRSHCLLRDEMKDNTTVYLHAALRSDDVETADLYSYRVAYRKGRQIGRITRTLKEFALDCNVNHDAILIENAADRPEVVDSQGNVREQVTMNDIPYTAVCDWMECDYKCHVESEEEPITFEKASDVSYDDYALKWREHQLKQRLKALFARQPFYRMEDMLNTVFADVPRMLVVDLLYNIVGNKQFVVRYGGRDGYIIYKNGYYIFQPLLYADTSIPIVLRAADFPVKREQYEPLAKDELMEDLGLTAADDVYAPCPGEEEDRATITTMDVKELLEVWRMFATWFVELSSERTDVRALADTWKDDAHLEKDIDAYIRKRARGNGVEYKRMRYRMQTIKWFAVICAPWTPEKRSAFLRVCMNYVWDEEYNDNERILLLFAEAEQLAAAGVERHRETDIREHMNENIVKIIDVGTGATRRRVVRVIQSGINEMAYFCGDGEPCDGAVIDMIENPPAAKKPVRFGKSAAAPAVARKPVEDTVDVAKISPETTAQIYGYIAVDEGQYIFKVNKPPVGKEKLRGGLQCASTASVKGFKDKLVQIGGLLAMAGEDTLSLTGPLLEQVSTADRICMLIDLVLRYLDVRRFMGGVRWFYRPISAVKAGHELKKGRGTLEGGGQIDGGFDDRQEEEEAEREALMRIFPVGLLD